MQSLLKLMYLEDKFKEIAAFASKKNLVISDIHFKHALRSYALKNIDIENVPIDRIKEDYERMLPRGRANFAIIGFLNLIDMALNDFENEIKIYKEANKTNTIKTGSSISTPASKGTIYIKESKTIYLSSKEPTRSYNVHTEVYERRGHYRTYKSGKKVWIDSMKIERGNKKTSKNTKYVIK